MTRRFVLIHKNNLIQYVDGKRKSVWDWVHDEETREEVLKTIEFVRTFDEKNK